jgi:hypothetical protein
MGSAAAAQFEFSGFPQAQAREHQESLVERYLRLSDEHGGLIPQGMLAPALNLSGGRISQLMAAGHFHVEQLGATKYVTGDSFQAFLDLERKNGRPVKAPSVGSLVKAALGK